MARSFKEALRPTDLYYFYGADGTLLYVGISKDAKARMRGHRNKSKRWASKAVRMTWITYPNRKDALKAERFAIETLKPLFNVAMNIKQRWPWEFEC